MKIESSVLELVLIEVEVHVARQRARSTGVGLRRVDRLSPADRAEADQ
jgi:hypothetical protein